MASADNARIDLYIHDTNSSTEGGTESNTPQQAMDNASPSTEQGKKSILQMRGIATASMVAQGLFNYATSNIGKYTGNSHYQNMVNNIQQGIQLGAMFMVNPYLAIGQVALQGITYALDENFRRRQESVELGQARARAGYSNQNAVVSRRTNYASRN